MTKHTYTPLSSFHLQPREEHQTSSNPQQSPKDDKLCFSSSGSASASSRVVDISKLHMFLAHHRTEPFDRPIKAYSLDDLGSHLEIPASFDQALSMQKQNEQLATRCVEAACNNRKFYIENDKEVMNVKGLKTSSLSSLVASSHEGADVIVYGEWHKKLLLLIEVQSSSIVFSERKAVLGAANPLHFLRNSDNNFDEFNSFVFPKKGERQSVMKVTVTWKNFHFQYFLKRLPTLDVAVNKIKSVIDRVPIFQCYQKKLIRFECVSHQRI